MNNKVSTTMSKKHSGVAQASLEVAVGEDHEDRVGQATRIDNPRGIPNSTKGEVGLHPHIDKDIPHHVKVTVVQHHDVVVHLTDRANLEGPIVLTKVQGVDVRQHVDPKDIQ